MKRTVFSAMRGLLFLACLALPTSAFGQGVILPGAGGMHRSMAGASTAVAVDALGALYWNPATMSGLPGSEVVIGGEALMPDTHLSSFVPANAFGPGIPAVSSGGTTRSDSGVGLATGLGVVYKPEGSALTYGLGLATLAGGSVNFPGNAGNPILAPNGPAGNFVLGPQAASLTVAAILPSASYQVNDRLAVGGGLIVPISVVSFDPAFFGPASDSNGDGLSTFPTGSHSRPFWGLGFRVGATYRVTECLTAGFSFISPQWFETWRFNARTETGQAFQFRTLFNLPMTLSAGLSYTGIENLLVSADVRYFDYRSTQLLGEPVVQGGAGWDNIWAVALGAKYQINESLSVQAGYLFNENPVPAQLALFNTQLPALTMHTVSVGAYYQLNESIGISLAYVHGFNNSITGNIIPIGTSTTIDTEYDSLAFGLHIKFGRCSCPAPCPPASCCTPSACESAQPIHTQPSHDQPGYSPAGPYTVR